MYLFVHVNYLLHLQVLATLVYSSLRFKNFTLVKASLLKIHSPIQLLITLTIQPATQYSKDSIINFKKVNE